MPNNNERNMLGIQVLFRKTRLATRKKIDDYFPLYQASLSLKESDCLTTIMTTQ